MEADKLGNVQQKISCVFETVVIQEQSAKRSHQPYKVVAGDHLRETAAEAISKGEAFPSEKLDGTCVCIKLFYDKPWLWARHDRKPNKVADRKFKKFQGGKRAWELDGKPEGQEPIFTWDPMKDFKDVPACWVPADGVELVNGVPQPDKNGHIPGWVPVEAKSRQHCWHSQTVEFDSGLALVLQPYKSDKELLEITIIPLTDLLNCTMELIGTNVNANPYRIGSKQTPLHFLVRHGGIPLPDVPNVTHANIKEWFTNSNAGKVEGIVWHLKDKSLYKLHRHHMELKWPVEYPRLSTLSVHVDVSLDLYPEVDFGEKENFRLLNNLKGQMFTSISEIEFSN